MMMKMNGVVWCVLLLCVVCVCVEGRPMRMLFALDDANNANASASTDAGGAGGGELGGTHTERMAEVTSSPMPQQNDSNANGNANANAQNSNINIANGTVGPSPPTNNESNQQTEQQGRSAENNTRSESGGGSGGVTMSKSIPSVVDDSLLDVIMHTPSLAIVAHHLMVVPFLAPIVDLLNNTNQMNNNFTLLAPSNDAACKGLTEGYAFLCGRNNISDVVDLTKFTTRRQWEADCANLEVMIAADQYLLQQLKKADSNARDNDDDGADDEQLTAKDDQIKLASDEGGLDDDDAAAAPLDANKSALVRKNAKLASIRHRMRAMLAAPVTKSTSTNTADADTAGVGTAGVRASRSSSSSSSKDKKHSSMPMSRHDKLKLFKKMKRAINMLLREHPAPAASSSSPSAANATSAARSTEHADQAGVSTSGGLSSHDENADRMNTANVSTANRNASSSSSSSSTSSSAAVLDDDALRALRPLFELKFSSNFSTAILATIYHNMIPFVVRTDDIDKYEVLPTMLNPYGIQYLMQQMQQRRDNVNVNFPSNKQQQQRQRRLSDADADSEGISTNMNQRSGSGDNINVNSNANSQTQQQQQQPRQSSSDPNSMGVSTNMPSDSTTVQQQQPLLRDQSHNQQFDVQGAPYRRSKLKQQGAGAGGSDRASIIKDFGKFVQVGDEGQKVKLVKVNGTVQVVFGVPTSSEFGTVSPVYGFKADVITPDLEATNGIIHIVDKIIHLPTRTTWELENNGATIAANVFRVTGLTDYVDSTPSLTFFIPIDAGLKPMLKQAMAQLEQKDAAALTTDDADDTTNAKPNASASADKKNNQKPMMVDEWKKMMAKSKKVREALKLILLKAKDKRRNNMAVKKDSTPPSASASPSTPSSSSSSSASNAKDVGVATGHRRRRRHRHPHRHSRWLRDRDYWRRRRPNYVSIPDRVLVVEREYRRRNPSLTDLQIIQYINDLRDEMEDEEEDEWERAEFGSLAADEPSDDNSTMPDQGGPPMPSGPPGPPPPPMPYGPDEWEENPYMYYDNYPPGYGRYHRRPYYGPPGWWGPRGRWGPRGGGGWRRGGGGGRGGRFRFSGADELSSDSTLQQQQQVRGGKRDDGDDAGDDVSPLMYSKLCVDQFNDEVDKQHGEIDPAVFKSIGAHIVPGLVYARSFAEGGRLTTLNGDTAVLSCGSANNVWSINNVSIIYTDLLTKNGVVHFIDKPIALYKSKQQETQQPGAGATTPTGNSQNQLNGNGNGDVDHDEYDNSDYDDEYEMAVKQPAGSTLNQQQLAPTKQKKKFASTFNKQYMPLKQYKSHAVAVPYDKLNVNCVQGQGANCVEQLRENAFHRPLKVKSHRRPSPSPSPFTAAPSQAAADDDDSEQCAFGEQVCEVLDHQQIATQMAESCEVPASPVQPALNQQSNQNQPNQQQMGSSSGANVPATGLPASAYSLKQDPIKSGKSNERLTATFAEPIFSSCADAVGLKGNKAAPGCADSALLKASKSSSGSFEVNAAETTSRASLPNTFSVEMPARRKVKSMVMSARNGLNGLGLYSKINSNKVCYNPNTHVCAKGNICPIDTPDVCGNSQCYNAKYHVCIVDAALCSLPNNNRCGEVCYNTAEADCIGGRLRSKRAKKRNQQGKEQQAIMSSKFRTSSLFPYANFQHKFD